MKIVQINTIDIKGGAARAAYRLHKGLIEIGQESLLLTLHKSSSDPTVLPVSSVKPAEDLEDVDLSRIQEYYLNRNRTQLSNTLFSLPYPGLDLSQLSSVLNCDIINLHWIAHFQSPVTLKKLLDLGKPVVWTLHDMWGFTGGCHYSAGCQAYQKNCAVCPQLKSDPYGLASAILQDKLELINSPNLVIVTPSKWLADCAQKSQLFKHCRIEIIPYGLETNVFYPSSKAEAKKLLNINSDTITLLVGADEGNEQRKGFTELLKALQICNEQFPKDKIRLLSFGSPSSQLQKLDIPIISFGQIQDDIQLAQIYSAADIFLLPSLEDNFPNTMLEAMSCGTPVVAFQVGGIPDLVDDTITGRMIPVIDIHQMAEAILELVFDNDLCKQMGKNSRQKIEVNYSLTTQAKGYLELYQDLLNSYSASFESYHYQDDNTFQSLSVPLDVTFGSNFKQIFYQIALQTNRKILSSTQMELIESKEIIQAMTTSKFWKIRELWFKLKDSFRK